jgi:signal transduction histidine kinase
LEYQASLKGILLVDEIKTVPKIFMNDEQRFKKVLLNLLSNALKFTVEGRIKVIVSTLNEGEIIKVAVEDTGIGIKEED